MKPKKSPVLLSLVALGILAAVATARADYRSAVLADAPLTYHRFSELDVTNAPAPITVNFGTNGAAANGFDVTTFRDDCIIRGLAGPLADPSSKALRLPYSPNTHYNVVQVPWAREFAGTAGQPFTVELWAKPGNACMSFLASCIHFNYAGTAAGPRQGWVIIQSDYDQLVTGHGWMFRLYRGATTSAYTTYFDSSNGGSKIDTNRWYHLVGVYTGSAIQLYVDGVLRSSASAPAYVPAPSGNNLMFGRRNDFTGTAPEVSLPGYQSGAALAECAIYNSALSAAEISAHYGAATTNAAGYAAMVLDRNPSGYWRFNEEFAFSVAQNSGAAGAAANGEYRTYSTTVEELQGPTYPGFETGNRALQVFGTNGQVRIPSLDLQTNRVTFEGLIKRDGEQVANAGILMHRSAQTNGNQQACGLVICSGNQLGYSWTAGNSAGFTWPSGIPIADGVWTYVAVAIEPTKATVCAYDGTNWYSAENPVEHGMPAKWRGPLRVGSNGAGTLNMWFKGLIDEPALYASTLRAGQLRSHALAAFGGSSEPGFISGNPVLTPSDPLFAGQPFTLAIDAYGASSLTYQWRKDHTDIPGATAAVYAKAASSVGDTGDYEVVVHSASGSITSAPAWVYINASYAPSILLPEPASRAVYPGGSASFSVSADGPGLRYQWKHAGTNLPGATASTLTIANVDAAKTGDYTVVVSNDGGQASPSAPATLSLMTYDASTYTGAVLGDAPEAYWRLDETSGTVIFDAMGRHDGFTYWHNAVDTDHWTTAFGKAGALAGETGTSLYFNGASGVNGNYVHVPYSPELNQATFSIECWVNLQGTLSSGASYLAVSSEDFYAAVTDPMNLPDTCHSGWFVSAAGTGSTTANWQYNVGGVTTWDYSPGPYDTACAATRNQWVHLVGTFDGFKQKLYANGVLVSPAAGDTAIGQQNFQRPLYIGAGNQAWGNGLGFLGCVDEVAYYKTLLDPARIKLHYQLGKYGTNSLPIFMTQPASQTVEFGSPVSFNPTLVGASPMTNQWKKAGVSVAGQTGPALSLPSVDYTDAGQYTLAVTNSAGYAVSAAATLVVTPPASVTNLTSRITSTPAGPKLELIWPMNYTLYYTTDLASGSWSPVPGATAPYYNVPINPATPQLFFKAK